MPYPQARREDGEIPAVMTLLVKSNLDSSRVGGVIAQLVREQDPNVPIGAVQRVTALCPIR